MPVPAGVAAVMAIAPVAIPFLKDLAGLLQMAFTSTQEDVSMEQIDEQLERLRADRDAFNAEFDALLERRGAGGGPAPSA